MIRNRHFAHQTLQPDDFLGRQHRHDVVADGAGRCAGDFELLVERGVLHVHLEHEAVLLRFGQRIGSLLLDRVLRGQHEERIGQRGAPGRP